MTFLIGSCSPNRKTNPLTTKENQAGKYESAAAQFRMHDIVFGNVPTKNGVPAKNALLPMTANKSNLAGSSSSEACCSKNNC